MSRPFTQSLPPLWLDLYRAIEQHIDAADRDEFLDAVVTTANAQDRAHGKGSGDAYIARVIGSLTDSFDDGLAPESDPT